MNNLTMKCRCQKEVNKEWHSERKMDKIPEISFELLTAVLPVTVSVLF